MINVYRRLKMDNFASSMVLQVHDELVFDVVAPEKERLEKMVKEEMESVLKLAIPLIADCNGGKNWLEAH
jgi:DNA polymerase-1